MDGLKKECFCKKCEHKWQKRVENPVACPVCNNKKWRELSTPIEEPIRVAEKANKKNEHDIRRPDII